jgi:hypothetical protein
MARFFKFSLFYLFTFLLFSCQEGGDAGELLGQWRLSGSNDKYVSFAGSVTLFRNLGVAEVFGNFQHVGDSLFIQCYSVKGELRDTTAVEAGFGMKPLTDIRLKVESLSSDALVVSKDGRMWSFSKY